MAASEALNVDRLVDEQKFGGFNLNLLVWSFLALFADGFEISSLGLAAPHIIRDWGSAPGAMGWMMSASLFGIMVGAPLFGYLGDRFGRRFAIILGCLVFGATTLAVVLASDLTQIAVLRFLTGIGMGGLMPNAIALNSELSPKRLRGRLVILMFMGITLGSAAPGFITLGLVPEYGWKSIFFVGGVLPLVVALALFLTLPESVKFLAARADRRSELIKTLRRMRPDIVIPDDATFAAPSAPPEQGKPQNATLGPIFAGGMAPITLLLWLFFATSMMANYFLNSWMPILFEANGVSQEGAALAATTYHLGALIGGLGMSFFIDRFGFLAVAIMLSLACPAMLALGMPGAPVSLLSLAAGAAGFFLLGAQFGTNAGSGLIYPTAYRAKGVGLAFAVGRVGSVIGPFVGAALIGANLPLSVSLLAVTGPMIVGAIAAWILAWLTYRRFRGWRLSDQASEGGAARESVAPTPLGRSAT